MKNEAASLSPATRRDIARTSEDVQLTAGMGEGSDDVLTRLVLRALEREYPYGPLGDAIRAEAACKPHTAEWCKCRDAVTTEAMALADAIRAAKGA